jgi:hypothetical protein
LLFARYKRVRLESRSATQVDPQASLWAVMRRLGIRVSAIDICSSAGKVVIAADDPRLIAGWHDVNMKPPHCGVDRRVGRVCLGQRFPAGGCDRSLHDTFRI